jgi:hypothetical protein
MNSASRSLSDAFSGFVAFFPNLVAGLIILVIGYFIALLLARVTRALLSRTSYDKFLAKLGLLDKPLIEEKKGSGWTSRAVFWFVMLVAVMQAARAWNLTMVSSGIGSILAYVPHIIGAAFIFAAALYLGTWARDRIAHHEMAREGAQHRSVVASSVRAGILALGAFMALRELQIAPEIVTLAFALTLAAIGLAAALAFGLGSRRVAERVAEHWYEQRPEWNGHPGVSAPPPQSPRATAP